MASTPDLSAVADPADFVQALRLLKIWAGNPSFDQLARRSGVPRSTLADAVKRDRKQLPALDVVRAFVQACGQPDTTAWDDTWRRQQASTLAPSGRVVPRELPPEVPGFSGRRETLKSLDSLRRRPATHLVTISGTAGVGKTALAVHWAHALTNQFPDGQLYINLRGYDPGQPVEAADAAGMLLRSLVPEGATIPPGEHTRVSLLRSMTASRRLLILLDNAASADQVRPLLPSGQGCLVVVTSRDSMTGLVARDGAQRIQLDVLSHGESAQLLTALLGSRADAEPAALDELITNCAYLPLALRLAAEIVGSRKHASIAEQITDLAHADPLDLLEVDGDEHTSLRTVFSWSYQRLPEEAARAFRLLGVHPGRYYDDYEVATVADVSLATARRVLRTLSRTYLLEELPSGRYTMHDLLHAYAVDLASGSRGRNAAAARLFEYYIWCASKAHSALYPYDERWIPEAAKPVHTPVPDLDRADQAQAWFDDHYPAIIAAAGVANPRSAIDLAATLDRYLDTREQYLENIVMHESALAGAQVIGDRAAEVRAMSDLGRLLGQTARLPEAVKYLKAAIREALTVADPITLSRSHNALGIVLRRLGRNELAIEELQTAVSFARAANGTFSEANALANLGLCCADAQDFDAALSYYSTAVEKHRAVGCRRAEGQVHDSTGSTYLQLGDVDRAMGHCREALRISQELRSPNNEVAARNSLGMALETAGDFASARSQYEMALALGRQIGEPLEVARALDRLGDLDLADGLRSSARTRWSEAVAISAEVGVPLAERTMTKLTALDTPDVASPP